MRGAQWVAGLEFLAPKGGEDAQGMRGGQDDKYG